VSHILVLSMAFDRERGGGSVRIAYDLANLLSSRGYKITVVCEDLFSRDIECEKINGITVLRYKLLHKFGLTLRNPYEHIIAVKRLINRYLNNPPNVIHGHHLLQYTAALDLLQSYSKSCYTVHSPNVDELNINWSIRKGLKGKIKTWLGLPIIRWVEKGILERSSVITTLSDYTSMLIASHYGTTIARKIRKISGWVDIEKFHPVNRSELDLARKQLQWPTDKKIVFVLRRLESRMGLDNLILALALVKKSGFKLVTYIGGSGTLLEHLKNLRNSLGLQDDVVFMGFLPSNQMMLAYKACDICIIPTAKLECFGIIALEALASGKPTLVTPIGSLPEILNDFEPQWIADNSTPESIYKLIIHYLRGLLPFHEPEELYAIVKEKYSKEVAVSAYENVLSGK